jgi:hypothetical protein
LLEEVVGQSRSAGELGYRGAALDDREGRGGVFTVIRHEGSLGGVTVAGDPQHRPRRRSAVGDAEGFTKDERVKGGGHVEVVSRGSHDPAEAANAEIWKSAFERADYCSEVTKPPEHPIPS